MLQPTVLAFLALASLLVAAGRSRLLQDPGTFWHIVVGERILEHGLPHVDWLTFSFGGRPWIAHQWLAEVAMALLHRLGGLDALLVATAVSLALLYAWLFHRLSNVANLRWAALLVSFALLGSTLHFHVRPVVPSLALFAMVYALLVDCEAGRIPLRRLWWVPAILAVWANVHGAALGGLATFLLATGAWTAAWALGRPSPVRHRHDAVTAAALGLAAVAAILCTPYGVETPRTWFAIMASPVLPAVISEHAALARSGSWQVLAFAAVYGAVLATSGPPRLRATTLLPLVWLALAVTRVRHAPLFAVSAALALPELLPGSRAVALLRARGVEVVRAACATRPFPRAAWALAIGAVLLASALGASRPRAHPVIARLDPARWPVALLARIDAAAAALPAGAPILNDMYFGGFLEYHAPRLRVFADDRCELLGDEFLRALVRGEPRWFEQWAERRSVSLALAAPGSPLDAYVRGAPGWREVDSSPAATLYRREPGRDALAP